MFTDAWDNIGRVIVIVQWVSLGLMTPYCTFRLKRKDVGLALFIGWIYVSITVISFFEGHNLIGWAVGV